MRMADSICALFKFFNSSSLSWKRARLCIIMVLSIFLAPFTGDAFEDDIEKDLQSGLEQSRSIIFSVQKKILSGASLSSEMTKLKSTAGDIRVLDLLLEERFNLRGKKVQALGTKALDRHRVMVVGYRKALIQYLSLIDSLTPDDEPQVEKRNSGTATGSSQPAALKTQQLLDLLNKLLPKKKRPIIGSLPYRHLNYPAQEPGTAPSITPAYKGGNKSISSDDTKDTPEAPISTAIATLAQNLGWNPVTIYEYVKNNIDTEWYWGCMKGAEGTLRQKSGNDCDQAALLTALLRASGYPTRYVRGVIEFFPDIEGAKNITGIDDPAKIAEFFQKAGIPFKPVIAGGRIANLQIEHIWIESLIPYANYRGAIIDEHGKTWLGLDTSIKVRGYEYNSPRDIFQEPGVSGQLSGIRDEYLGLITLPTVTQTPMPLEYLQSRINSELKDQNSQRSYADFLSTRVLRPEVLNILPAGMQFVEKNITKEYTEIPDELIHKVKISAVSNQPSANNDKMFDLTLPLYRLSNQQIVLSYEPETVQDQEIIDSYGGLGHTPAYLVRLRPVLKINGERIVVGTEGLPMGSELDLTVELTGAFGAQGSEKVTNTHIVGNLSVIGISAQRAIVTPSPLAGEGRPELVERGGGEGMKDAARLLYEEAMNYIDRWNEAEHELASLLHLAIARPRPTVVILGGVIDVTYLLDTPHGFTWKGVYVDADMKSIEAVSGIQGTDDRVQVFMKLSSLQGSILENRIFEDDFQVQSVSTAKLMTAANGGQVPIITIDTANVDSVLPTLSFDQDIKEDIANAVNQNLTIRIPQAEIGYQDWTGTGYIKENRDTGESGWMLSGMIAGGMTVWSNDRWPAYYQATLSDPYAEPSVFDPASARFIEKISATDLQQAPVGTKLGSPLQVMVHTDEMRPVAGALVTFTIKAGKGRLTGKDAQGNQVTGATVTVPTNGSGIASAWLTTGQSTTVNSTYWYYPSSDTTRPNPEQVGENLVDATLPSGTGIAAPFAAYGFPKAARTMKLLHGDGLASTILFVSGFASVIIQDEYENPISNLPVTFDALAPEYDAAALKCDPRPDVTKLAYFIPTSEPCLLTAPVWGACGNTHQQSLSRITNSQGALAEIMMGGVPYALYPFKATCTDVQKCKDPATNQLLSVDFNQYTYDYNCGTELHMQTLYPTDAYGNNINAGKTDTQIPVMAKMYYLLNSSVSTSFDTASVTFSGQLGTAQANGLFSGRHTLTTGLNWVNARGSATINGNPYTGSITFPVYGVTITLTPPTLILLDSFGYAKSDTVIPFTIAPAEYTALTAYMVILKNGQAIEYIPVEKQGQGYATIGRGFWFDVNSTYEAQVILNSGTGVEIRGDRVTIPVAQLQVMTDENPPKEADEIRFSDGSNNSNGTKKYHIEIKSQSWLMSCETLTGRIVTRSTATATLGQPVTAPDGNNYASIYSLTFYRVGAACLPKIIDTVDGNNEKYKFIFSNRPRAELVQSNINNTAVLYGGIGNKFWLEVGSVGIEKPIEPVGIVILGIDGMRQDVLYAPLDSSGNDVKASYLDPNGCGPSNSCYVELSQLKGMCTVLGGKYDGILGVDSSCDPTGADNKHIKFQNVTTIFPSITFAAWASIFTGMPPSATGITGNEFFARDLYDSNTTNNQTIPGMDSLPSGVVTLDADGAAMRAAPSGGLLSTLLGKMNESAPIALNYVMPAEFLGYDMLSKKMATSAPGNALKTVPLWNAVNDMVTERYQIITADRCDQSANECRTVSIFNQYAAGVDWWGTPSLKWMTLWKSVWDGSLFDSASTNEAVDFISNYFKHPASNGKRKRFPALFSVYLPGLDHDAHMNGMEHYKTFMQNTVDTKVSQIVSALKGQDEFDNKIFIIVADHGHTAMPTDLTYIHEQPIYDLESGEFLSIKQTSRVVDMPCDLKNNFAINPKNEFAGKNARNEELNNNNLHIWELAEMFKTIGKSGGTQYKVLASEAIANLFTGVTSTGLKYELPYGATASIDNANVIAALNGPMAHIYLKGANGWSDENPDIVQLSILAKYIKRYIQEGGVNIDNNETKIFFNKLLSSVDRILIRVDGVYKDFMGIEADSSDNSIGPNAATINETYFDVNAYVSAFNRITGMNHPKRSGDIVLIMKDSTTGVDSDRYSTSYACMSWHGSLNPSDSYVPFIISYPGGSKAEIQSFVDTTPGCTSTGCDGNWRVTDVIKKITHKQYGAQ